MKFIALTLAAVVAIRTRLGDDECEDYKGYPEGSPFTEGDVVKDKYGDTCSDYTEHPEWCQPGSDGNDDNFNAQEMCCECQSQAAEALAHYTDDDGNVVCSNDFERVDKFSDNCAYYDANVGDCNHKYASSEMDPVDDCCACGGGAEVEA